MQISLAYSPCPNDTALFGAIASGALSLPRVTLKTYLHDIEILNQHAQDGDYDITKLSVFGYLKSRKHYQLLDVGAALGFGCGPLLVSAHGQRPDLATCRILFPGRLTTAYLLFRILNPESPIQNHHFAPYNEIAQQLTTKKFDCGIIIHETRFTYRQQGLKRLMDLGEEWERLTQLPIPLGCCVIRHDLAPSLKAPFTRLVRQGFDQRARETDKVPDYVQQHATELEPSVINEHIRLYLNDYSRDLGQTGKQAIQALTQRAESAGLLDECTGETA